jgi:hypothetical protein
MMMLWHSKPYGKGKYIDLNNNLKSIISKIIKKPEYQIIIQMN